MREKIENYAKEYNVPIMQKEGIEFLINFIKENNIKSILEVGTAIGYSAIRMALVSNDISITTIERDKQRYDEAVKNIKEFNLENQIELIYGDALEVEITGSYDLIFIDAAKAQSIKFFQKYEKLLKKEKFIITDNLDFHGLVNSDENMSRNLKQLIRKIKNYIQFLKENEEYETKFYNIGDGISVSKRRWYLWN